MHTVYFNVGNIRSSYLWKNALNGKVVPSSLRDSCHHIFEVKIRFRDCCLVCAPRCNKGGDESSRPTTASSAVPPEIQLALPRWGTSLGEISMAASIFGNKKWKWECDRGPATTQEGGDRFVCAGNALCTSSRTKNALNGAPRPRRTRAMYAH
jgi:hypothetical protein